MSQDSYKGISNRGRFLLNQQENATVDFKEHLDGLHPDDLVAFANTDRGGSILIGIREITLPDGRQGTDITGTEIGDSQKLTIINKAASCLPPVEVQLVYENIAARPFIRIEISPSQHRPHCTASGTYKIRENGRNKALNPRELLAIFMESEGDRFFDRFTRATAELHNAIHELRTTVHDHICPPPEE